MKDLEESRLKISRIDELNDPFEFFPIEMGHSLVRQELEAFKKQLAENRGLLSFSKSWSNPVLWSHYAEQHRGLALGFDVASKNTGEVFYVESRLNPAIWLGQNASRITGHVMLYTKFSHWSYEDEVRMVTDLKDKDPDGNHYFNFSDGLRLTEIIVGAASDVSRRELESILNVQDESVQLIKARPAFRTFRVTTARRGLK